MIVCNVFDIKKLEKLKIKEAVKVEEINRSLDEGPFITIYEFTDIRDRHYLSF